MAYHSNSQIYRDTQEARVGGVCAGLSEYLRIDVTILRILASVLIFAWGSGLLLYIILWVILPAKPYDY